MSLSTPETTTPRPIATLRGNIIEVPGLGNEISVRGENVGIQVWSQIVANSQSDQRQRYFNVFYNKRSKNFESRQIIVGTAAIGTWDHPEIPLSYLDILGGIRGVLFETVAHIHTHPMPKELDHLRTHIPSTADVTPLTNPSWRGSMIVLDQGGAHLLIRTGESVYRDNPPPQDLIEKVLKEIGDKKGTVADIQRKINGLISEYGISYYFKNGLEPNEDGTVTFKKP